MLLKAVRTTRPFYLYLFAKKALNPNPRSEKSFSKQGYLWKAFPPPPPPPRVAGSRLIWDASTGCGEAAARGGTMAGHGRVRPGNLTEVGERRAGHGTQGPAYLQEAGATHACGLRPELGPHKAGHGHGSSFVRPHVAAAAQNWLEGARAGARAARWSLEHVGGRAALRAWLRVSRNSKRRHRLEVRGRGRSRGPGGQLLLLLRGLLLENLLRGHDLLAFGNQVALFAGALLPATLARMALDWHQKAMVPAPRALGGAQHLVEQLGKVCLPSTAASSGSCRASGAGKSSAPEVPGAGDIGYTCNKAALSTSQELQQDPCIFPPFSGVQNLEFLCLG